MKFIKTKVCFHQALVTLSDIGFPALKDLRNKSWKPECVGSFNMDWRILVIY
jgi:hypothetical protein